MNLIQEIRSDLINESVSISTILRKARFLANELRLPELSEWTKSELSGYQEGDRIPSYRSFKPTNLGTFTGFGSVSKNVSLPTADLPDIVKAFAENLELTEGVATLEGMSKQKLSRSWPPEMVFLSRDAFKMTDGSVLIEAHQPIPPYLVTGVLDNVKNKLLEFILELDASNITPETVADGTAETQQARQIFNIHIQDGNNIIAAGENVTQKTTVVHKNDIESLLTHLRGFNFDEDDIDEISTAVQQEPIASDGSFGPKVNAWLVKMINKAASGTINVGAETAATAFTGALNGFYGI